MKVMENKETMKFLEFLYEKNLFGSFKRKITIKQQHSFQI